MVQVTSDQIAEQVIAYIQRELAPEEADALTADDNILTGGYVDSVGIVRLTAHLSEQLQVEIPASDLIPANFRSPRIIGEYLQGRLSASPARS